MVQHVIFQRNLSVLVSNDGECQAAAADLIDVLDPVAMAVDGVGRQSNQLDASFCELGLQFRKCAQLGRANGGEVLRVAEEDDPVVADELVEVDRAFRRFGLEVGGNGAQTEAVEDSC